MIFDDENILVDSIQKDIDNDLNLIKIVREQYGTFDHIETRRILNHMFSEILNDETNPHLKSLIESYNSIPTLLLINNSSFKNAFIF